ncbi:MAG TPA: hypothetical protein VKY92_14920 [Verrucomicrobiae bacterium]|nr:hypothetical protein [Verrucomicrobiae bacterium]
MPDRYLLTLGHKSLLMDPEPLHYSTGEEVHAGDRVRHNGSYATVVFVSDGELEEFSPGYEEYTGSSRGLVVCDDDGGTSSLGEPDDRLSFLDRG